MPADPATWMTSGWPGDQRGRARGPVLAGALLLAAFGGLAVAGWAIGPSALVPLAGAPFERPSWAHPLGTDDLGRDLLAQLALGAQVSISVALAAASIATALGTLVGISAGLLGGWADRILSRALDVVLALPFLPLVLVIGAYLGSGPVLESVVIGSVLAAHTARVIRSQALEARSRGYVTAALAMGGGARHVAWRHLLPVVTPLVVPQFVRVAGAALLAEASLSFLGLGDPTVPSWGTTLSFAQARGALLTEAWQWWVVPPGVCITLALVGLALVGSGLEESARPQLRQLRPAVRPSRAGRPARDGGGPAGSGADGGRIDPAGTSPVPVEAGRRPVLHVAALRVRYPGSVDAVAGVDLDVVPGETVGIVGGSGAGKTTLVMSLLGLLPPSATVSGEIRLDGQRLHTLAPSALRRLRGDRIALVPQNAMHALDPVIDIRSQVREVIQAHRRVDRAIADRRATEVLDLVGIPADRMDAFPHEFSGGMRQRVVIAMALANDPAVLIADEPTTGLDVVRQAGIVSLLRGLRQRSGMAMLLVSHDLPMVLGLADRVVVMHGGRIVEAGPAARVAAAPADPNTRSLLGSIPALDPALSCVPDAASPGGPAGRPMSARDALAASDRVGR